ncbi:uncharacterized protein PHALS_09372 [Plasmopara halstedii]|uniref:Uncharacterized protein n=1 Tax=Plasmopara halstedii TaxID=4781 RepID=A0A0P1A5R0_PLAHL|nr:uncharacterized protein PHALS_09372 [Plasmopara halstedii]CEG35242.1 hypothetical protein PHALS_09372 [Plasmopara halstedii]|eukprot:XP_024571611.1 hypothetical protein PHALS_09372 [Plasmopara halstedii]
MRQKTRIIIFVPRDLVEVPDVVAIIAMDLGHTKKTVRLCALRSRFVVLADVTFKNRRTPKPDSLSDPWRKNVVSVDA